MRKSKRIIEPSFLFGMAMVFGYGMPMSNRVFDRLVWKRAGVLHGQGISESWKTVAEDFNSVLKNEGPSRGTESGSGSR